MSHCMASLSSAMAAGKLTDDGGFVSEKSLKQNFPLSQGAHRM